MASNFFYPARLHNFEMPDHWGDDLLLTVTKRPHSYRSFSHKPTHPPTDLVQNDSSMKQSRVQRDSSNEKLCLLPGEVLSNFRRRAGKGHSKSGVSKKSKEVEPGSNMVVKLPNWEKMKRGAMVRIDWGEMKGLQCQYRLWMRKVRRPSGGAGGEKNRSGMEFGEPNKVKKSRILKSPIIPINENDATGDNDVDDNKKEKEKISRGGENEENGGVRSNKKKEKEKVNGSNKEKNGGGEKEENGGVPHDMEKEKVSDFDKENDKEKFDKGKKEEKKKISDSDKGNEKEINGGGRKRKDKIEEENEKEVAKVEEGEKRKKFNITIPLTKWEIEEDIFILTEAMPNIHPKKRSTNLQRVLNVIFPLLHLTSIMPDSYKVIGPSKKRKRRS